MHWIDISIMGIYLVGMMVIGLLAKGKGDSAEDYFTTAGGLSSFFGTLVVGLSIAGTFFSGISFISYPSVVYSNGLALIVGVIFFSLPASYLVLRYWFLPRYLSGGWRFPYDIIEARFGPASRTIAASLFVLMRVAWMAAMIYAPTVAIMTMARLDDKWFWPIVLITGLTNTIYTVFSGVRGVIVTEAIQMCVIAVGIGATIIYAITHLPVPLATGVQDLSSSGRLNFLKFSVDPTEKVTVFTVVIGITVANLANYIADQMSLQRYLATADLRATSRSFLMNLVGVLAVLLLLATVGLSLFVFYTHTSDPTLPVKVDRIFPHFVATQLPVGIAGLVLAALLAATSIPSGINTLAGVLTLDFHARLHKNMTQTQQVNWAKVYSLVIGVSSTLAAGIVDKLGTLFDTTQILLGVFAGPLLACMVLAISKVRCHGWAMSGALIVGSVTGVCAAKFTNLAVLWLAPLAAVVTAVLALVPTFFISMKDRPPEVVELSA